MREVVESRIQQRINRGSQEASGAVLRLVEDSMNAEDFLLKLGTGAKTAFDFSEDVLMNVAGEKNYSLHVNAIEQLGSKFGVPVRYLKDLNENGDWGRGLIRDIMNQHVLHAKQDRFLIRAVGDEIRGVLSDSYKRLDSEKIVEAFINQGNNSGARFAGGYNNGLKMWLEIINPKPIEIQTVKNGIIHIAFGGRISTSDFGKGSVDVRSFNLQGICLNGMVRESLLKEIHLGGKLPEDMQFSRETILANTKALLLKVRDVSKTIFSENFVREKTIEIQRASGIEVDLKVELEKLKKGGKITKLEFEETEKVLLKNDPEDGVQGESTLWKLTQGLTAMARTRTPERERELQEVAGSLMPEVEKVKSHLLN